MSAAQEKAAHEILALRKSLGDVAVIEAFLAAMAVKTENLRSAKIRLSITYPKETLKARKPPKFPGEKESLRFPKEEEKPRG